MYCNKLQSVIRHTLLLFLYFPISCQNIKFRTKNWIYVKQCYIERPHVSNKKHSLTFNISFWDYVVVRCSVTSSHGNDRVSDLTRRDCDVFRRGIITATLLSSPQTTRTACRQRRSAGGYWLYTYARVTSTVRNRLAEYNTIRNAVDISGAILSLWDL